MLARRAMFGLLLPATAMAQLPPQQQPPPLPPLPAITLARGVTALPAGAWRVAFPPERELLEAGQRAALGRIGAVLNTGTAGRITLISSTSEGDDISTHRRLTLARARAVKAALIAGGLAETRIDIRALGRTEAARDAVDILTPTAPR